MFVACPQNRILQISLYLLLLIIFNILFVVLIITITSLQFNFSTYFSLLSFLMHVTLFKPII
jgi:hypothetical protein